MPCQNSKFFIPIKLANHAVCYVLHKRLLISLLTTYFLDLKKDPPKPSPPGFFQLLLDNINRSDPGAFELPQEIRSYFRGGKFDTYAFWLQEQQLQFASDRVFTGRSTNAHLIFHFDFNYVSLVETKSDGGFADRVDYKPFGPATINKSVWEDALELKDKKGEIRLCYHCGKSALRERWLISCERCPLHWHLDCLSPPMASPPSRTRKWMCPNHAFHVQVHQ